MKRLLNHKVFFLVACFGVSSLAQANCLDRMGVLRDGDPSLSVDKCKDTAVVKMAALDAYNTDNSPCPADPSTGDPLDPSTWEPQKVASLVRGDEYDRSCLTLPSRDRNGPVAGYWSRDSSVDLRDGYERFSVQTSLGNRFPPAYTDGKNPDRSDATYGVVCVRRGVTCASLLPPRQQRGYRLNSSRAGSNGNPSDRPNAFLPQRDPIPGGALHQLHETTEPQ